MRGKRKKEGRENREKMGETVVVEGDNGRREEGEEIAEEEGRGERTGIQQKETNTCKYTEQGAM